MLLLVSAALQAWTTRSTLAMVLDAKAPAVAQSWSAGASLAVTASSWAPALADGSWRLVVEKARVIENDALPRVVERWRADANTVETTIKTFNVTIAPNPGLGIALEEIVLGSGEQELPLVLVEGLVEGGAAAAHAEAARAAADGAAAGAWPMAGDTLTEVRGSGMAFDVECAPYDGVVGAIGEALASGGPVTLTLARVVRRGRATVTSVDAATGEEEQFTCYEGENLRLGLLRRGLKVNDLGAQRYDNKPKGSGDCGGNGLCATCVVSVLNGGECLTPRGASESNLLAQRLRWRQSCRAFVTLPAGQTDVEIKISTNPRRDDEDEPRDAGWFRGEE